MFYAIMKETQPLKIVICINYLAVGGSQSFALALAKGLSMEGSKIFVYDFNLPYKTKSLSELNSPLLMGNQFELRGFNSVFLLMFEKYFSFVSLLSKAATYLVNIFRIRAFRKFVLENKINIVSSHLMAADTLASLAIQDLNVIHVATMHGSYEGFPSAINNPIRNKVFSRMDGIIYLTQRNIEFLNKLKVNTDKVEKRKIYNGYISSVFDTNPIDRNTLGLSPDDFVFIQVARGAADKGWRETCEAFLHLEKVSNRVKLILVGSGEALDILKEKYSKHANIIFYGYSGNPLPLIQLSDAGLLPSYYKGESLPNTIIEYLNYGLPVIASDIGEVRNMIGIDTNIPAGFVLENSKLGPVDVNALFEKMELLLNDNNIYHQLKNNAKMHFDKFSMKNCTRAYLDFFQKLLEKV
jgi:glycosyltransferase involved in cell wall biosynthesis